MWLYATYLGPNGVPISLLWGVYVGRYYNDTWTLWDLKGLPYINFEVYVHTIQPHRALLP